MIGILGAGATGLTLGTRLSGKADFEILEMESESGGLCRSVTKDGFTFDIHGSHILFSKDSKVMDFVLACLGKNVVKCRRNTKIFYKGRMIKYPFENGLNGLSKQDNYECLMGFIKTLLERQKGKPKNFKDWIYRTFGSGIAEKYLIPYNEKVWNFKTEEMSADWVNGRVPKPPVEDIIKSSLGIETEGYTHQLYFYYPKTGGVQALMKSMEEKLDGRIRFGFEVKSVKCHGNKFVVSDGRNERTYNKLFSTIPIQELVASMDCPSEVKKAAKDLKYNSIVTVMLGLDEPRINDISWLYFPRKEDGKLNRASFPFNYSMMTVPGGKSSLLAEITCNENDKIWNSNDKDIIETVRSDMERHGIIKKNSVCFSEVARCKYAYVVYDLNYNKNIKVLSDFIRKCGIVLVGRFAEFKYMNMDACIKSAFEKARLLNEKN